MVAKAITPLLGGTPAVWVTCMLFFQALLLAGYVYVHGSLRLLGPRKQAIAQLILIVLPLLVMPIVINGDEERSWHQADNPTFYVLLLLLKTVGPAFLVLSMSAPLLQGWFAAQPGASRDPYILYAASNAGSVVALTAYPFLIEPHIGLRQQFSAWQKSYLAFIVLVAISAMTLLLPGRATAKAAAEASTPPPERTERTPWRTKLLWCGLAFVPSTFMMGLTTFVTTDVAPVPLFWVVPLLLYLVTFILVFANRQLFGDGVLDRIIVIGLTLSAGASILGGAVSTIVVHLTTFFFVALLCHLRLVRLRPHASELTEFFLWLSIGGALGGLFNGVIAPVFFSRTIEYPIALVLAALCRFTPGRDNASLPSSRRDKLLDFALPLLVGGTLAVVLLFGQSNTLRDEPESPLFLLGVAVPFLINYATRFRVQRFALGMGAIFIATGIHTGNIGNSLHIERNFFGVIGVAKSGATNLFMHGNIVHGVQWIDPARKREPLAYHHRNGPLGDVFAVFGDQAKNVAVVGLGAGTMAAYAKADQAWTFYEINPAVVRVALTPHLFSYLADAFPNGKNLQLEVGDARLRLEEAKDGSFSIIVLDAFSSDAVPVHLLTREALDLYVKKLEPTGTLVFNITNRFVKLGSVMATLAQDHGLNIVGKSLRSPTKEQVDDGLQPSTWVVMSKDAAALEPLVTRGFQPIKPKEGARVWTDDYSDIISAYRF